MIESRYEKSSPTKLQFAPMRLDYRDLNNVKLKDIESQLSQRQFIKVEEDDAIASGQFGVQN